MTTLARWFVVLSSAAAAFAGAAFVAGYSAIEQSDARLRGSDLPTATEWLARLSPAGIGVAAALLCVGIFAAIRRDDTTVVVSTCFTWLFAFAWVLACLFVWRMPYMLIGAVT